jgi:hypothetical protein
MTVPGNPAKIDIKVRTGDTETFAFNVEETDGTPIDLGDSTFQAQIRSSAAATSTIASFSTAVTSAGGGQFYISLSSGTTSTLTPQNAVWDLQQTVSGVISTLIAGDVRIVQDVTR